MANLNQTLQSLAEKFASQLVEAVRSMSLDEILAVGGAKTPAPKSGATAKAKAPPAKRGRRVSTDEILAELKKHKDGLRSEALRKALGTTNGAMRYYVLKLIADKRVGMRGTRNSAVYFAK